MAYNPLNAELSDLYLFIGIIAVFIGLYFIYPPAGLIFVGVAFIFLAYMTAQPEKTPIQGVKDGIS
jgi:hypothetical protein